MHICISRFYVVEGDPAGIAAAFRSRVRLVDDSDGFISFWAGRSTQDLRDFTIEVRFRTTAQFEAWYRSHLFKEAHAAIPGGVKLDRSRSSISHYEVIAE